MTHIFLPRVSGPTAWVDTWRPLLATFNGQRHLESRSCCHLNFHNLHLLISEPVMARKAMFLVSAAAWMASVYKNMSAFTLPLYDGSKANHLPKTSTWEEIDPDWIFTASCRHFKRRLCSELLLFFLRFSRMLSLGVVHYLITSECQEITSVDLRLCEKGRWTVSAPS